MGLYGAGLYGAGLYGAAATITAIPDSAWPPRYIVEVTGLALGSDIAVYRVVAGTLTLLRSGTSSAITDPSFVVYDAEYPFGTPFTYLVTESGADSDSSPVINADLGVDAVVISDAITGLACQTVITAWPDKDSPRIATRFTVGGRTAVVSAPRGAAESSVEFLTDTDTGRQQMIALLNGATSNIVLIRQPGGYNGVDGTYVVLGDTESRYVQRGADDRRLWTLDLVESSGWAPGLTASGWTYADVTTAYAELTYADLTSDFTDYLSIAVFDWGTLL